MEKMKLDELVASGAIISYVFRFLNDEGVELAKPGSGMRETEELTLTFPSGEKLVIDTFCSGSWGNTSLVIK